MPPTEFRLLLFSLLLEITRGGFSVWLSSPFYRVSLYAFGGALKTSLMSADLWVINVQLASCTSVIFRESTGNRFNPLFNFSLQRLEDIPLFSVFQQIRAASFRSKWLYGVELQRWDSFNVYPVYIYTALWTKMMMMMMMNSTEIEIEDHFSFV